MSLHNFRRARATAISVGAATALLISTGIAAGDPAVQPGTETPATTQPGTTTPDPAPAPDTAPAPAAEPAPQEVSYTPLPQTDPVPQPALDYVPQAAEAAQPLAPAEPEVIYIEGEPIVITETEYVDREVVEESGGLYILTEQGREWITADRIIAAATENYQGRDQADKDRLNLAAAASALGATGGFLLGAGLGGLAGGAGSASAAFATTSIPVVITAPVPIIGQATATGATAAAIAAGILGTGVGIGLGGSIGSVVGADGGANASGQKPAVQEFLADVLFTLENGAREDAGFRGLVGDKPSGLPGYRPAEESTDTRDVEGTLLEDGRHSNGQDAPSPLPDFVPRHALPEVPTPQEAVDNTVAAADQVVEDTTTAVETAQTQAQDFAADPQGTVEQAVEDTTAAVDNAQQQAQNQFDAAVDNAPELPELPDLPF